MPNAATPATTVVQQLVANPAIVSGIVQHALSTLPFPVSPNIRQRLTMEFKLTPEDAQVINQLALVKLVAARHLAQALHRLHSGIERDTNQNMQQASLAATAELAPSLTAGSVEKPAPALDDTTTDIMAGLSEGGGEEPGEKPAEKPATRQPVASTDSASAPAAPSTPPATDTSGVSSRPPPQRPPGMFNQFGGTPQQRGQTLQHYGQETQAEQLGEGEQAPPTPDQAEQDQQADEDQDQAATLAMQKQQDRRRNIQRWKWGAQAIQEAAQDATEGMGGDPELDNNLAALTKASRNPASNSRTQKAMAGAGTSIGNSINAKMKSGNFNGFLAAALLAVTKDAIDFMEPSGVLPLFIDLFVTGALGAILANQGSWFLKMLKRRYRGKALLSILIELVPLIELAPTYTMLVMMAKIDADKEVKKLKNAQGIIALNVAAMQKGHQPNQDNDQG
ncbi:MAG: hypothetical protein HYV33_00925 [Candidatus Kerfeldbacteria bacterium]|nr:hypothetical protein [Candidatus Kerfeldbacteria bacterium]